MSAANARMLIPISITSGMVKAGTTVAEPDTTVGESAWVASASYTLGQEKTYSGSIYICVKAHSGSAVTPDNDPINWLRKGPTNRTALFDDYINTSTTAVTTLTYVIQPGFFNGLSMWKLEGDTYSITVKDSPGGAVIGSKSGDLYEQAAGFYELLFQLLSKVESISMSDIPIAPNAEVTIVLTAGGSNAVSIGTLKLGDWRYLFSTGTWGGTQYGASSNRTSYTYREYNEDGTLKRIVARPSARDVRCSVVLSDEDGTYADSVLTSVLDTAVVFEATDIPKYGYLNTIGFVSSDITADNYGKTTINLTIKGNI